MQSNNNLTPASAGESSISRRPRRAKRFMGTFLVLLFGVFVGRYLLPAQVNGTSPFQLVSVENGQRQLVFPTFWEAWDTLHSLYIEDLDDQELFYGAVVGMVNATGDPYTSFANPDDTKQFQETLSGSFSGVGIEIGVQKGLVTVIAPLKGSPADQAGIEAGDIIVGIDDEPVTSDQNLNDVVKRIRGRKGEPVKLAVIREGDSEPQEISVTRDTIVIESVHTEITDGIAHIELSSFNGDTTEQFLESVRDIQRAGAQGIILDVRSNPGGFLQTSVDIASHFLKPGTIVVTERGREESSYKTKGSPNLADIPLVVLINKGSASASEILAGALNEQRQAPLVGEKSFGKGSVQELITLKDGSSLKVTVAKWFTPNGRSINEEGIEPTITVEDNRETEEDEQLDRAREELRQLIAS